MISKALEADILRLYHAERWRVGTIASQLSVHHSTVRRVLARAGLGEAVRVTRPSMIEPFLPWVQEVLTLRVFESPAAARSDRTSNRGSCASSWP